MKSMTLGCDPEIFLVDHQQNLISAIEKIGGSKSIPRPLFKLGKGFAVQEDNVALEYNIPASRSADEFAKNINKIMKHLSKEVSGMGLAFSNLSAAIFPPEQLEHPRALEFGCDPDYNAWTLDVNPKPKADNPGLRSCGGHVHVGADVGNLPELIKRMDLFLAVPSQLQDKGILRKQLYGKAGAFRQKPYGGEYRTLSNYWIFNEALIKWVWNNTQLALDSEQLKVDEDQDTIFAAVNAGDDNAAKFLINKYQIPVSMSASSDRTCAMASESTSTSL